MSMTPRDDEAGFTLVELLVVMTLLSVVGAMVTAGLVTAMETTRDTQNRVQAMAELQRGTERITREVRAACPVDVLDDEEVAVIVFRDGEMLRHTFSLDVSVLRHSIERDNAGTWEPVMTDRALIEEVTAPTAATDPVFAYFDERGDAVVNAHEVRLVQITLQRDLPEDQPPVVVQTSTSLRNGGRSCD